MQHCEIIDEVKLIKSLFAIYFWFLDILFRKYWYSEGLPSSYYKMLYEGFGIQLANRWLTSHALLAIFSWKWWKSGINCWCLTASSSNDRTFQRTHWTIVFESFTILEKKKLRIADSFVFVLAWAIPILTEIWIWQFNAFLLFITHFYCNSSSNYNFLTVQIVDRYLIKRKIIRLKYLR